MNVLVVDDEDIALSGLVDEIKNTEKISEEDIHAFKWPSEALKFAEENTCEIAFLDIEMREMNGIDMAKKLQTLNPQINIIFITGYEKYANDAFELHASGYLNKPVTSGQISKELNDLRYSIKKETKLEVRTFGNFEVFYKNKPLSFKYTKTKELLAYLVDRRGVLCSLAEIRSILWEDDDNSHISYMKNLKKDLTDTFSEIGYTDLILVKRGSLGIKYNELNCDYFDLLKGKKGAREKFTGEYMSQYSWAEATLGMIINIENK